MSGRTRADMLYHPLTAVELFRQIRFSELSPVAKRLVIADRLNRGEQLNTGTRSDGRLVSRVVGEDGFEVIQDLLLLVPELEAENRMLRAELAHRRRGGV